MEPQESNTTPWHLWAVGIVTVLWSAIGAMDYVMTQTQNEQYMSNFTPEQLSFFYSLPAWTVAAWAVGVWGGVLGGLLLLLRNSLAVWVLLASVVAVVLTAFQNYVLSNGMEIMGDLFSLLFTALIFVCALLFYLYARAMQARGIIT